MGRPHRVNFDNIFDIETRKEAAGLGILFFMIVPIRGVLGSFFSLLPPYTNFCDLEKSVEPRFLEWIRLMIGF